MHKRPKESGKGKSVLHSAAKHGYGEIVHYLTGAIPPPTPRRSFTPTSTPPASPVPTRPRAALSTSSPNPVRNSIDEEFMQWKSEKRVSGVLEGRNAGLERAADPWLRDNFGRTALHYAAMVNCFLLVFQLLIRIRRVPNHV